MVRLNQTWVPFLINSLSIVDNTAAKVRPSSSINYDVLFGKSVLQWLIFCQNMMVGKVAHIKTFSRRRKWTRLDSKLEAKNKLQMLGNDGRHLEETPKVDIFRWQLLYWSTMCSKQVFPCGNILGFSNIKLSHEIARFALKCGLYDTAVRLQVFLHLVNPI